MSNRHPFECKTCGHPLSGDFDHCPNASCKPCIECGLMLEDCDCEPDDDQDDDEVTNYG